MAIAEEHQFTEFDHEKILKQAEQRDCRNCWCLQICKLFRDCLQSTADTGGEFKDPRGAPKKLPPAYEAYNLAKDCRKFLNSGLVKSLQSE